MDHIKVKAVPGRVARTSRNGEFIPDDRYVRVAYTPYIQRLLNVHGDIVQEPAREKAAPPKVAPPKTKETNDGN